MKTLSDYQCEVRSEVNAFITAIVLSGKLSMTKLATAMDVDAHSLRKWRDGIEDIDICHYQMLCELNEMVERAS